MGKYCCGVELIKRHSDNQVFWLTFNALASGAKMGKTADGAIWLDKELLSPYDYWQFLDTDDNDVIKFLKFFTDEKIESIENLEDVNINDLKVLLANKTTEMLHGKKESKNSEKIAKETFSNNSTGSNLPSIKISASSLKDKLNIIDLVIISKFENSKSEIRRLINGKAIKINNDIILNEKTLIDKSFFNKNYLKLSIGKKRHIKIELI